MRGQKMTFANEAGVEVTPLPTFTDLKACRLPFLIVILLYQCIFTTVVNTKRSGYHRREASFPFPREHDSSSAGANRILAVYYVQDGS
jgi:hypothetical protein